MTTSATYATLRHSALLFLGLTLALTACKKPRTGDVYTLNAPGDVEAVGVCIYEAQGALIADFPSSGNCVHPAELTPESDVQSWDPHIYLAAISNFGERALQIYSLDTRSTIWLSALRASKNGQCLRNEVEVRQPYSNGNQWTAETNGDHPCSSIAGGGIRAIDNDRGTPGNNGVLMDGAIGQNTPSHFAGIQWVSTKAPHALVAVNTLTGRKIPSASGALQQQVTYPIADLASVTEGGWLIAANPQDNELVAYQPTFHCAGQTELHIVGCDMHVELGTPTHIPLNGSPRHIVASHQGDVYVSADLTPFITRVSLNDDECPPSAPCEIPLTHTCNDGLDNDGNGLIDAEDPSCYTPFMNEGDLFPDAECADGVDNDGDGLIDALDPKCLHRNFGAEAGTDNSCTDGIDNDGDGLIDLDDPDCASGSEFPAGSSFTPSAGVTIPRYTAQPVYPGPIALTPSGDILIVAEGGGNRAEESSSTDVVFLCGRPMEGDNLPAGRLCTTPNTLITLNQGDPARNKGVGLRLPTGVHSLLAASRAELLSVSNPDEIEAQDAARNPDRVTLTTRRVFAVGADGYVYSIDIDQVFSFVDAQGENADEYAALFRYTDGNAAYADVRNMRLQRAERVPTLPDGAVTTAPGIDSFYPALRAIAPELLEQNTPQNQRLNESTLNSPEAFIRLPTEERFCFGHDRLGCLTNPPRDRQYMPYFFAREKVAVKHDARVFDENWTLAWEGNLQLGMRGIERSPERNDAVLLNNDGWIRFLGDNACETVGNDSQLLCDMNVGWNVCPELEELCQRGADFCGDELDLCQVCPRACASKVDLCRAGVQPGDIAIIPPLDPASYCRKGDVDCSNDNKPAQCLPGYGDPLEPGAYDLPIPAQATIGNEYRVVEVRGDAFRVEPLNFTDRQRYRLPSTLPSTTCYRRPFTVEVVAANNWTLSGARVAGTDTPYVDVDGFCAYETDVEDDLRNWRPNAEETILTRFGFEFHLLEGDYLNYCRTQSSTPEECAHAMRGFRIGFATEDNMTPRVLSKVVGPMGMSASTVQNLNLLQSQLLFIDAGTNELAVVGNDESLRGTLVP